MLPITSRIYMNRITRFIPYPKIYLTYLTPLEKETPAEIMSLRT